MAETIERIKVRSKNVRGFMNFTRQEVYDDLKIRDEFVFSDINFNEFCRMTYWHPGTITDAKRLKSSGLTILKEYYPHYIVKSLIKKQKQTFLQSIMFFLLNSVKSHII